MDDILKLFDIGEKVCLGLTGRKKFTIIGIQNSLPTFGGGQTLLIASGRIHKEVLMHEIREATIPPIKKKYARKKKEK